MCTATWFYGEDGYEMFFNRDEQRDRPRALPPRMFFLRGTRVIAPMDTQAGGTWLGVNEWGVLVALLNRQSTATIPTGCRSRGQLALDLLDVRRAAEAIERLNPVDARRHRPFTVLAFDRSGVCGVAWDGRRLRGLRRPLQPPMCSSSYTLRAVIYRRQKTWAEQCGTHSPPDRAAVLEYHRSHHPARGPYSVCMHREDAQTVSFSHVRVGRNGLEFCYVDGPPCQATTTPRKVAAGLLKPRLQNITG